MANVKMNLTLPLAKTSLRRIVLTLIGSFAAYGIFDNSIAKVLAEYGFRVHGEQLFQYTGWYILTVVLSGATVGFLAGAVIRKQGKLYGAFPCLAWLVVMYGLIVHYIYPVGYSITDLIGEWRGAELVWDWYSFTHGMFAMFIYGTIAGSIGGHLGEKTTKRHQAEGRNEEDSLFLFLFAPKARTIVTTLLLLDCFWFSILSIGIEWTILKWWIVGIFFVLSHFSTLFVVGALLGVLSAFSFSILLIPFFAPFVFQSWWNAQKTRLRKAGIYLLFLVGLPLVFFIGWFLTYWGVGLVVNAAGEQGIQVWGILLDHETRPDHHWVLSEYYREKGKDGKAKEHLKLSNDELMRQAQAKLQVGKLSAGASMLERIIEQDENHIKARLMLAEILLEELGDIQRATPYFEEAFQMVPQDSADEIYLVDACIKLGEVFLEDVADTQRAIVYFKKALEMSPEDFFAAYSLWEIYFRLAIDYLEGLGNNKRAIIYLEEALKIFPEDPDVLYYLGSAYKKEDTAKSKQYLREAIKYGSPDSLYEDIVRNAKEMLLEHPK